MSSATIAMPWLQAAADSARRLAGAHAVLLHGAPGDGLFEAGHRIVADWLCEQISHTASGACGHCAGCLALAGGTHPDVRRVLPEALARELGAADVDGEPTDDGEARSKRKPSRQIRIGEVRAAIDWLSTSSSRGGGKVVWLHPADALNPQAANALLKTLEEPPARSRLLLSVAQPALLLPTVRSRCQAVRLLPPSTTQAQDWLRAQGVAQGDVLLAAASGRPLEALAMASAGIDAPRWSALPQAVRRGHVAAFNGWPLTRVLDALQKLCHDAMCQASGAPPTYFPPGGDWPPPGALPALARWSSDLALAARQVEHPWNEGLAVERLVLRASRAWSGRVDASDTLAA